MRAHSVLLALLLACASAGFSRAQTAETAVLTSDGALRIVTEAVRIAKERKAAIGVVVANREGRVIATLRMDGVSFLNLDVAQSKAVTAAALGIPTDALEQAVDSGKHSLLAVPGLGAIGGGIPVTRGGQVIAGVGVSGGAPADDKAIAEAAAKAAGF